MKGDNNLLKSVTINKKLRSIVNKLKLSHRSFENRHSNDFVRDIHFLFKRVKYNRNFGVKSILLIAFILIFFAWKAIQKWWKVEY